MNKLAFVPFYQGTDKVPDIYRFSRACLVLCMLSLEAVTQPILNTLCMFHDGILVSFPNYENVFSDFGFV